VISIRNKGYDSDNIIWIALILIVVAVGGFGSLFFPELLSITVSTPSDEGISVPVAIILVLAGIMIVNRGQDSEERHILTKIFLIAFLLRAAFGVLATYFLRNSVFYDIDAGATHHVGVELAKVWKGEKFFVTGIAEYIMQGLEFTNKAHYYMAGAFYYLLGMPSWFALSYLHCWLGALTVIIIYKIARLIFERDVAVVAAKWATFFPALIVWSALPWKDTPMMFFECAAIYAVMKLQRKPQLKYQFLLVACIALAWVTRRYIAHVLAAAALVTLFFPVGKQFKELGYIQFILVILGFVALSLSGIYTTMSPYTSGQVPLFSMENVEAHKLVYRISEHSAAVEKGFLSNVDPIYDVSTPLGMLLEFPHSFAYFMFAPFPWHFMKGSLRLKLAFSELLLWWWMIPTIVVGVRYVVKYKLREALAPLLFSILLAIMYAFLFYNMGVAYRQRPHIIVYLLIFFGVGRLLKKEKSVSGEASRY